MYVPEQVVTRSCCFTLRFFECMYVYVRVCMCLSELLLGVVAPRSGFECMYVYVCTLYMPERGVIAPCSGININTCISVVVHVLSNVVHISFNPVLVKVQA